MKTYSFDANLDGQPVKVTAIDLGEPGGQAIAGRTHHIWMFDRSYSLYHHLRNLIDQAKSATTAIKEGDLLTVMYFSGEGQHGVVLAGATVTTDTPKLLESLAGALGTTCFSEVMNSAVEIAERYTPLVDQTVITMFTDGCPVTSRRESEEEDLTEANLARIASVSNLVAFNAIGYSNNYNARFLNQLVGCTPHGRFIHNSKISDFYTAMLENMETASALRSRKLVFRVGDLDDTLLYVTSKTSALLDNTFDTITLTSVDTDRNIIYYIGDVAPGVTDNGVKVSLDTTILDSASTPREDWHHVMAAKRDWHYAMAAKRYGEGRRHEALKLVVAVGDKYLADCIQAAFTVEECGAVQNKLETSAVEKESRFLDGVCDAAYLPPDDAFCVMDLLKLIFDNADSIFYIPFSPRVERYTAIGRKAETHGNIFVRDPIEVRSPVTRFVWNKERLNLSLQVHIPGAVRLNAKGLARVNAKVKVSLPEMYPAEEIRSYTLVKDGELNMRQLEFLIEAETYGEAFAALPGCQEILLHDDGGVAYETIDEKDYLRVLFDLDGLPIINRTYIKASESIDDIHNTVEQLTVLEAHAKVVNFYLEKLLEEGPASLSKRDGYAGLSVDQIAFLEESGVSRQGVYNPTDRVVASTAESDSYMTRKMVFAIKGAASLPSANELAEMRAYKRSDDGIKLAGKAPNVPGKIMLEYERELVAELTGAGIDVEKHSVKLRRALEAKKKSISAEIMKRRFGVNVTKLAKVLTGDWFEGLTLTTKGERVHERADSTLVVKTDRVKAYF